MTDPAERTDPEDAEILGRAVATWRRAQVVHLSPSWEGQPEARALAEEVAVHRGLEGPLWQSLADPSQLVVAYALVALEMMESERLGELPETLLANRSNITIQMGSFRNAIDLGGFVRQVRSRAGAVGGKGARKVTTS